MTRGTYLNCLYGTEPPGRGYWQIRERRRNGDAPPSAASSDGQLFSIKTCLPFEGAA